MSSVTDWRVWPHISLTFLSNQKPSGDTTFCGVCSVNICPMSVRNIDVLCSAAYCPTESDRTLAGLSSSLTWPVNLLVAADGAEGGGGTGEAGQPEVTEAAVPAPALLLHAALRPLLLPLEVRPGEGLHGGQQPHLAHLPAQRHGLALLHAELSLRHHGDAAGEYKERCGAVFVQVDCLLTGLTAHRLEVSQ